MERKEVLSKIQEILVEITDNEDLTLTESTKPADVEDWDSLAHFNLIMELQCEFNVKFSSSEIQNWFNVGSIVSSILGE